MSTPPAGLGERLRFQRAWDHLISMPDHQPPGPAALAREMGFLGLNGRLVALRTEALLAAGFVRPGVGGIERWHRPSDF
jgi:hypothetical protein